MTSENLQNPNTIAAITGKAIILDTNVLVEGYRHAEELSKLLQALSDMGCPLTTVEFVRIEFLSGNRNREELNKKMQFYTSILTYPELPTKTFQQNMSELPLIYAFGKQAQNFKAVDFMIAAAMKRYAGNVLLLTNDHNDFTPQLFDLKELLPLSPLSGGVITLGLYAFSEEKYAALLTASS